MDFGTCEEGKQLGASPLHAQRQGDRGQLLDAVQPQLETETRTRIKTQPSESGGGKYTPNRKP